MQKSGPDDEWALFGEASVIEANELPALPFDIGKAIEVARYAHQFWETRDFSSCATDATLTESWIPFVLAELGKCCEALSLLISEVVTVEKAKAACQSLCQSSSRAAKILQSRLESRPWRDAFEVRCLLFAEVAAWAAHESWGEHRDAIRCIDNAIIFDGATDALLLLADISERGIPLESGLPDEFPSELGDAVPPTASLLQRYIVGEIGDRAEALSDVKVPQINVARVREMFEAKEPFVLEGAVADWPALEKWRKLTYWAPWASRLIPIEISEAMGGQEALTLGEFLLRYIAPSIQRLPSGKLGYLAQHKLFDHLPLLRKDFAAPAFCPANVQSHAWIGTAGTVTRLHTDGYDNCFVQVCGFKFVRLVSAAASHLVYAYNDPNTEASSAKCNHSHVDAEKPDLKLHPKFASACPQDAILGPGDCLFIPKGCWHYVRGLTPSISVSLTW